MARRSRILVGALLAFTVTVGLVQGLSAAAPDKTPASPDLAGYSAAVPSGSTSYSGDVKLPTVTCSPSITGHILIGEFIGTTIGKTTSGAIGLAISVDCSDSTPEYFVDIIANGTDTHMLSPVSAGNVFKFVATASTAEVTGKATDMTTKASISATGAGGAPNGVAVSAGSDGSTHWPPFEKINFTKVMVNGKALAASSPTKFNEGVIISKKKTVIEIRTSPLSTTGEAFSLHYVTNSP